MLLTLWRLAVLILNVVCIAVLLDRYRRHNKRWAGVTRDYWWTLLLWSVAAVAIATQGIIEHRKLTAGLVFVTIASLATPVGLWRKEAERKREATDLS